MSNFPKLKAANGDKPQVRAQLSKEYMVEYAALNGTPEQRAIVKKAFNDNKVEKANKISNGKPFITYNLGNVREIFCQQFFPELCSKPKAEKKAKKTFADLLDEL